MSKFIGCTIKQLPDDLLLQAASTARDINPANAPMLQRLTSVPAVMEAMEAIMEPAHIAAITSKYWGGDGVHLTVGFMEKTVAQLASKILSYMNAWGKTANVQFSLTEDVRAAKVRVSRRRGGYWSYLGTDILHISQNQQTMNLESFSLKTPESEYARVVTHETGHTLGCPHEHLRKDLVSLLDRAKTIAYFRSTQGWSADEVVAQVLTPLNERSLMSTPVDQDSIMCYQIPGICTKSGKAIHGGAEINNSDASFMAKLYPKKSGESGTNVLLGQGQKKYRYTLESDTEIQMVPEQ